MAFAIAINQCILENNVTQLACLRYSAKVLYSDGRVTNINYWEDDVIDYKEDENITFKVPNFLN